MSDKQHFSWPDETVMQAIERRAIDALTRSDDEKKYYERLEMLKGILQKLSLEEREALEFFIKNSLVY